VKELANVFVGETARIYPHGLFGELVCRVLVSKKADDASVLAPGTAEAGRGVSGAHVCLWRLSSRKPCRKPRVAISGHVTNRRHGHGLQGLTNRQSWPTPAIIAWVRLGPFRNERGVVAARLNGLARLNSERSSYRYTSLPLSERYAWSIP
jgi:hypothetical protein